MNNTSRTSVRTLVMLALLVAMSIVFSRVLSISTGFVRFNLGSLPVLLAGIVFGPGAGFAVGALAVMGPLESGLQHQHSLLFSKSVIDGVASIVFASTMGLGVALSGITVFVVEGSIALLASVVAPYLGEAVVNEITFVGSLLIVGISLNLLGVTKLRILNMVPAILMPILLCRFMG